MRESSSDSVRVFWLDSQKMIEEPGVVARRMKARHPEIEEVLLFGSLARGQVVPGSDADFLVSLSAANHVVHRALEEGIALT